MAMNGIGMIATTWPLVVLAILCGASFTAAQDVAAVKARLMQYPQLLQGGAEFNDPNSYQSQALLRTASVVGVESITDSKLYQYYSLYCIYNATNMVPNPITDADPRFIGIPFPPWLISDGWDAPDADPCGNTAHPDGFHGIECDELGRVTNIDLFENLMTGYWPPEVVYLALDGPFSTGAGNLYRIDLYRNVFLHNNYDTSWATDLGSNFTSLILEETGFQGDIPRLPDNLVNLNLAGSNFTGGLIDENFEGIDLLNFVDLDGNHFRTSIPSVFNRLPSLQYFYASDCRIEGDLSFMEGMDAIFELWADGNPNITGTIPTSLGDLTTLQSLSLSFNSLTGTVPTELGRLIDMKQMWWFFNQLRGEIPSELGLLTQMSILQLESNAFVGSMPQAVCDNTIFPTDFLAKLGADCDDILFMCPCCTCCDLAECSADDAARVRL